MSSNKFAVDREFGMRALYYMRLMRELELRIEKLQPTVGKSVLTQAAERRNGGSTADGLLA